MTQQSTRPIQKTLDFDKSYRLKPGQKIIFDFYPLPPSVNKIYKHFLDPKTRKVKTVASTDLVQYKKDCDLWAKANAKLCKVAHLYLRDEPCIKLTVYVALQEKSIYTKKGELRQSDVSNRGKALYDCLSTAIQVDDKHFTDIQIIKCVSDDFKTESCRIEFQATAIPRISAFRKNSSG